MASARTPVKKLRSTAQELKRLWRSNRSLDESLKTFARKTAKSGSDIAKVWLHNKTVNSSNPPKGIGNTHKPSNPGGVKGGKK